MSAENQDSVEGSGDRRIGGSDQCARVFQLRLKLKLGAPCAPRDVKCEREWMDNDEKNLEEETCLKSSNSLGHAQWVRDGGGGREVGGWGRVPFSRI